MNMNPNEETFENVTYDELQVGQSARMLRTLTAVDTSSNRETCMTTATARS